MRLIRFMAAASFLVLSGPSFAQEEWVEFSSREDFFTVNFPRQPDVRQITYMSEYGLTLPARVYSVDAGRNRYGFGGIPVDCHDTNSIPDGRFAQIVVKRSGTLRSWPADVTSYTAVPVISARLGLNGLSVAKGVSVRATVLRQNALGETSLAT